MSDWSKGLDSDNAADSLRAKLAAAQQENERLRLQLSEIAKDVGRPDTVHVHSAVRVKLGELRAALARQPHEDPRRTEYVVRLERALDEISRLDGANECGVIARAARAAPE